MTTFRGQGRNTLRKASSAIANAAALSGLQKGRSSGKKCRTRSVVVFSLCRGRQGINPMLLSDSADAVARGGYGGGCETSRETQGRTASRVNRASAQDRSSPPGRGGSPAWLGPPRRGPTGARHGLFCATAPLRSDRRGGGAR